MYVHVYLFVCVCGLGCWAAADVRVGSSLMEERPVPVQRIRWSVLNSSRAWGCMGPRAEEKSGRMRTRIRICGLFYAYVDVPFHCLFV